MEDEDIVQAQQAIVDVQNTKLISNYDPSREVEHSLVSLLRHRIEKLQEDVTFEQHIKDAILARLPEAQFAELIRILDTVQNNTNVSVEKILAPFIPRMGERVPLLDEAKKERKSIDESVFDQATKDDLQALHELSKALKLMKEKKQKQIEAQEEEKK